MAKLNIFLGHKCNFKCSYCLQSFDEDEYLHLQNVDIKELVAKLAQEVKDRTINKVAYWGGEPMLYFNKIIELHEEFAKHGVKFSFIKFLSNGSLLTEESVAKLNEMDAHVGISIHTGFGTPRWDMIKKLNKWSIIYLFSGRNPQLDVINEVKKLEIEHDIPRIYAYAHWVRATENCSVEDYFTDETLKLHEDYLYYLAHLRLTGHQLAHDLLEPHINKMKAKLKQVNFNGSLCVNNRILTVDMYGNKFTCHHSPVKENYIGNIFKGDVDLENTSISNAKAIQMQYVNSAECMSCEIRSWCRGNCYLSKTHDIDCRLQKIKHKVFSYVLENETKGNFR